MKKDGHWRQSNLEDMWNQWLMPLAYGEMGCVVTYPGSDYPRRVLQLTQEKNLSIKVGDYRIDKWLNVEELRKWLSESKGNVLIVCGLETLLLDGRIDLIKEFQAMYRKGLKILFLTDKNILDKEYAKVMSQLIGWQPRMTYFGVYSDKDSLDFIEYLQRKWQLYMSQEKQEEIVRICGGVLAFIKEMVWQERIGVQTNAQLNWQIQSMWNELTESGRDYLRRLVFERETTTVALITKQYFEEVGWVNQGKLKIPLISSYVRSHELDPIALKMEKDQIVINGNDYSHYFSPLQKVLLAKLLSNSGKTIEREDLIIEVWGEQGTSDWAFDSQIKRLRDRLDELGVSGKHLITKRGRGVIWRE